MIIMLVLLNMFAHYCLKNYFLLGLIYIYNKLSYLCSKVSISRFWKIITCHKHQLGWASTLSIFLENICFNQNSRRRSLLGIKMCLKNLFLLLFGSQRFLFHYFLVLKALSFIVTIFPKQRLFGWLVSFSKEDLIYTMFDK